MASVASQQLTATGIPPNRVMAQNACQWVESVSCMPDKRDFAKARKRNIITITQSGRLRMHIATLSPFLHRYSFVSRFAKQRALS